MSLEKFIRENKEGFNDRSMLENATTDFENLLKNELHRPTKVRKLHRLKYFGVAASVVLLLTVGYLYNSHVEQLEIRDNLVIALDESDTNSSRLETIYAIEEEFQNKKEDEKILAAFFKILKEDSDANSKIAVIDALLKFPDNASVRTNLIDALGTEKEPIVQLKLIKSVAVLREQRAKVPLQKIMEDKETLPLVKGNASALLAMLNQ